MWIKLILVLWIMLVTLNKEGAAQVKGAYS